MLPVGQTGLQASQAVHCSLIRNDIFLKYDGDLQKAPVAWSMAPSFDRVPPTEQSLRGNKHGHYPCFRIGVAGP